MGATNRRGRAAAATAFAVVALALHAGCNAIIGANDPTARVDDAANGAACVLNSDCTTPGEVCIFRVCSPPCHTDDDCAAGSRCLQTNDGTACVVNSIATCGSAGMCPAGSTCENGACRNTCGGSSPCLGGQTCTAGICVGSDPTHDPGLDAGTDAGTLADSAADQTSADSGVLLDSSVDASEDSTVSADSALPDSAEDAPAEAEGGCGDTSSDVHNCGTCGHDCTQLPNVSASGLMCSSGRCVYRCAGGHADCADAGAGCGTDLSVSPNCGACGVGCSGTTPVCAPEPGNAAAFSCQSGCPMTAPMLCGSSCVDTNTSNTNCGGCGTPCATTQPNTVAQCTGGMCKTSCASGATQCGAACVNETSDDNNCGGCGMPCTGGEHCVGGTCQCTNGTHSCGGQCVPNDMNACGANCAVCTKPSGGTVSCDGTQCLQACNTAGDFVCQNACVDESSDPNNCGNCGMTCSGSTPLCVAKSCVQCTSGMQCGPNNTPQNCVGNQWVNQTACAAPTPTCFNGGCVQCTSGSQCNSNNTAVQTCVNDQWQTQTTCTASQICRAANCVNAVEDVGWSSALGSSYSLSANILYVFRLPALSHTATLNSFGTYGNASGANAKLVLYNDNGAGTAPTGSPVAWVSNPLALVSGAKEQSANPIGTALSATTYWLGIVVDSATTISSTSTSEVAKRYPQGYNSLYPDLTGVTGIDTSGTVLGIYINVQDTN